MAEDDDRNSDDLTEEASQTRLQEFRDKGQVFQSRELTSAGLLFFAGLVFYVVSESSINELKSLLQKGFTKYALLDYKLIGFVFGDVMKSAAKVFLPLGLAGFFGGIVLNVAQSGFIFSFDPISPDLNKVDPISGLKKVFSFRSLVEGIKSLLKIALIGSVGYVIIEKEILKVPGLMDLPLNKIMIYMGMISFKIFVAMIVFMLALGAFDYLYQRHQYLKQLRMTKEEAKQELKEREGDPLVKSRIRGIQREFARRRMMKKVPTADVIVTNPTHFAVAVRYDKKFAAPIVVAKGADLIAQRIKEIAKKHDIPIVENKPLAQALYKSVKLNRAIPKALYQAMAEVLAYVYKLKRNKNWI